MFLDEEALRIVCISFTLRQICPDLFCDIRHERVEQAEHILQDFDQDCSGYLFIFFIVAVQSALDDLDVPVAELVPDQIVCSLPSQCQIVFLHGFRDVFCSVVDSGNDPLVLILKRGLIQICQICHLAEIAVFVLQVHDNEPGCVPQFIGKVSGGFQLVRLESHVISRCDACGQHEPQCIRTVLIDDLQRVDPVAQGFAHLATLCVAHQTVYIHMVERHFACSFQCREHHPYDPEEDDVVTRYQHIRRIEVFQIFRLFRPA